MSGIQPTGNRSQPEMWVSAKSAPVQPLRPMTIAPVSAFVQQLGQRYAHRAIGGGSDMALRRSTPAVTLSPHYHRTQVQLAPRLQLTLWQRILPSPNATAAKEIQAPLSLTRLETQVLHRDRSPVLESLTVLEQPTVTRVRHLQQEQTRWVRHLQRQPIETVFTEQLVQRLVDRGGRVETVATARTAAPAPLTQTVPQGDRVQPVAQVVKQAVIQLADATIAAATASQPLLLPTPAPMPRADAAAPVDVNRLAEQVIQTIDRRLLAYRERLGRV
jgi:hypothetical protein